jgi:hypothetical protein
MEKKNDVIKESLENAEMRDRHLKQTPPEKGNVQNEN